ncbi:MAG: putative ABC transporter permease [Lachnospiraceae bacterium]|nr:putative ABC transporter permease [Lachnospiraceae bacterium]
MLDLIAYLIIYSFLGWVFEVFLVAIKDRRFRNRGFVNLPFCLMYGVIMDMLIILWPSLAKHDIFKFVVIFSIFAVVQSVSEFISDRICKRMLWKYEDITPFNGQWMNLIVAIGFTFLFWAAVDLLHPIVFLFLQLVPNMVVKIICGIVGIFLVLDFLLTLYVVFRNRGNRRVIAFQQKERVHQDKINSHIYQSIWNRLEEAYPNMEDNEDVEEDYIFAKGICLDKMIWVFLISAFLGDLIEMVYCRLVGGVWMSRSSVLYGPFSIVWGLGAVVLTLVLSKFSDKEDRYIFTIGALLGGAYEYLCSLFTEIVLGTVFWDYSWMPFNIGGRTNLLYMVFWGILAVVWIKICYPKMSSVIEKLPALAGKIITWGLILFMICNASISALAMIRYTERKAGIEANNAVEVFLDTNYEDELIENVWPNMVITD